LGERCGATKAVASETLPTNLKGRLFGARVDKVRPTARTIAPRKPPPSGDHDLLLHLRGQLAIELGQEASHTVVWWRRSMGYTRTPRFRSSSAL